MTTATDNFNRADSTGLGANWSAVSGFHELDVVSHEAGASAADGSSKFDLWTHDTFGADQFSEAVADSTAASFATAVCVRMTTSALTQYSGGCRNDTFGNNRQRIWKWVAGSATSLAVSSTTDIADGDDIRLEVSGTSLTLKVNGSTVLTATDSAISTGQPGLECRLNTSILSNAGFFQGVNTSKQWSGGDLGGGGGAPTLTSISPTSGYANPTVNVRFVGVTLTGTNLNGTSPSVNVPSGWSTANLSPSASTATVDITVPAGTSPGSNNITYTANGQTSTAVTFTITNPSGGTGILGMDMRGGFTN
jgi:hypothetical protein